MFPTDFWLFWPCSFGQKDGTLIARHGTFSKVLRYMQYYMITSPVTVCFDQRLFGAKRNLDFHGTRAFVTLFNRQPSSLRPTVDIKEPNNPVHGISNHSSRLFFGSFFNTELIGSTKLWTAGLVTLDFQIFVIDGLEIDHELWRLITF